MAKKSGGGLNLVARLSIQEAIASAKKLTKELAPLGVSLSKGFDKKTLTDYQQELLKIRKQKEEDAKKARENAAAEKKAKAEQVAAEKSASLAFQEALRQERLAREEINTQIQKNKLEQQEINRLVKEQANLQKQVAINLPKKTTQISNSQEEIDAYLKSTRDTGGRVATSGTSELIRLLNKDFDDGKISAAAYKEEMARLNDILNGNISTTSEVSKKTKELTLSKKELEKIAAQEKYNTEENTKALKNSIREMNNAKGSIEQRRAALIRLQSTYDRLSSVERETPAGQRLKSIISGVTTQLKEQEAATGRAQRNVGNYTSAFTNGAQKIWSGLRMVSSIIPGIGIAGLLAFAVEPLLEYVKGLDLFKSKIQDVLKLKETLNSANLKGAQDSMQEIVHLKTLYRSYKDSNIPLEKRKNLYRELQDKYPDYFKNINFEEASAKNTAKAYNDLTNSILATARARASEQKIAENSSRQLDNEQKIIDLKIKQKKYDDEAAKNLQVIKSGKANGSSGVGSSNSIGYAEAASKSEKKSIEAQKEINNLKTDSEILNKRNLILEKNITDQIKKGADQGPGGSGRTVDAIKSDIESLQDLMKPLDTTTKEYAKHLTKLKALKKELKLALGGKDTEGISEQNQYQTALKSRNDLQDKIQNLIRKNRISLQSENEQEIANEKAKYDELRKEAIKFNTDKKNIAKKLKVDASGLNKAEEIAISSIKYNQETKELQKSLEEQKKLYEDFEQYKADFGEEAAKKRFGNEVNYFENIQKEIAKTIAESTVASSGMFMLMGGTGFDEGTKKRLEVLEKFNTDETNKQQKQYQDLLKQTQSFEDQRNLIIETATKEAKELRDKGDTTNADRRIKQGEEELKKFDDDIIHQIEGYKKLFDGFGKMSSKAIEDYIKKAKDKAAVDLANKKITQAGYDAILKAINEATAALNSKMSDQLERASNIFKQLADNVDELSFSLSDTLRILGDMISAAGQVQKGIVDTNNAIKNYSQNKKDAGGGFVGSLSAGLNVASGVASAIGAVAGFAKGVINFFKAAKESAKQAKEQLQKYSDGLFTGEIEYNRILRERKRLLEDINKITIKDLKDQQTVLKTQASQAQADFDRLLAKIRSEGRQVIATEIEKYGGFLGLGRKSKVNEITSGIAGLDYDQIEQLYTQGKLNEATKKWFEELRKAKDELEAIGISTKDVLNAINEAATGTTADAIAAGIINGLKQGKRSFKDFAGDFSEMMQDASLSFFRNGFLNPAIDEFYKNFAKLAEDGLSDVDVDALGNAYSKIISEGQNMMVDFEKIIGGFGGSIDDLRNDLINLSLTAGDAAEGVMESFSNMLKSKLMKDLEGGELDDRLKEFKKKFDNAFKNGASSAEIAALKAEYAEIAGLFDKKIKDFEQLTGEQITIKVDDAELIQLKKTLLDIVTTSQDLQKDLNESFTSMVKNQFIEQFNDSEIAKRITEFNKKFKLLSEAGMTSDQMDQLRAEYNELAKLTAERIEEFEKRTGEKITAVIDVKIDDTAINNLRSKIFELFKSANSDFKAGFDQMINELLLEKFYNDVIANALSELNKKMEEARKGGPLTKEQIAEMRNDYDRFITDAFEKLSQLEEIAGIKIGDYAKEAANTASESVSSEYENVKSTILSIFDSMDLSSENIFKNFNAMMKKALLTAFDQRVLQSKLQGFMAQYDAISKGVLPSEDEKNRLQESFKKIIEESQVELKKLMEYSGISLENDFGGASAVGKIQQELTEKTGSEFLGLTRASHEVLKTISLSSKQIGLSLGDMLAISRRNLEYSRQTASNTSVLPEMARDIKRLTGQSAANVLPSSSESDLGLTG